jgi:hypothetical protein
MDLILIVCLTAIVFFSIIVTMQKKKNNLKYPITKQSEMHNALKVFFSRQAVDTEKKSQIAKRSDSNKFNAVIVDDKAYWVIDNIFWVSNLIDGRPNMSEAEPVDIYSMPKKELDKMLLILDNLGGGKNERGNSGNK